MFSQLNDSIEKVVASLLTSFPEKALKFNLSESALARFPRPKNPHMAPLIMSGITNAFLGREIAKPSVHCLFNALLVKHVFQPFLPGLDEGSSEILLEIFDRIHKNGAFSHPDQQLL